MLWSTLYHKLGRQTLKFMQHNHVYALIKNPKTHKMDKVNLVLKFDATGRPYFIQQFERKC